MTHPTSECFLNNIVYNLRDFLLDDNLQDTISLGENLETGSVGLEKKKVSSTLLRLVHGPCILKYQKKLTGEGLWNMYMDLA